MNLENFKSLLLTVLVFLSIFLTWNIWTYTPPFEKLSNTPYIKDELVRNGIDDYGLVYRPYAVLFHKNGNHFGFTRPSDYEPIMKDLRHYELESFENVSNNVAEDQFLSFVHGRNTMEVIYPSRVSIDMLRKIFKISDRDVENVSFDRIVLKQVKEEGKEIFLYFVDYETKLIYRAASDQLTHNSVNRLFEEKSDGEQFASLKVNESRVIFLPMAEVKLPTYQYYVNMLDIDKFKNALFRDPSAVTKDELSQSEEYTDGSRLMDVDYMKHMLSYANPAAREETKEFQYDNLVSSMDFINEHGGWTDSYRYDSWHLKDHRVSYRLFIDDYPVFNDQGMAEIVQELGNTDVHTYRRPMFTLEIPDRSPKMTRLADGLTTIENTRNLTIPIRFIEAVRIGYDMEIAPGRNNIVVLKPRWFVKAQGVWQTLDHAKGGELIGLE